MHEDFIYLLQTCQELLPARKMDLIDRIKLLKEGMHGGKDKDQFNAAADLQKALEHAKRLDRDD